MKKRLAAGNATGAVEKAVKGKKMGGGGVFDKMPTKKINGAPSHVVLRSLAHLNGSDNGRGKKRSTMTAVEMQNALRRQARYQAAQERAEKIAELKAKGVYIQTSEEREKEQQEVEDLVEKARHEAMSIQKREERKAKKDGTFEDDGLDDDDEYDGEYDGNEDEQLSGSEEEGEEDGEEDVDDDENHGSAAEDDNMDIDNNDGLIAHMASEAGSEDEEEGVEEDDLLEDPFIEEDHDDETDSAKLPTNRRRKVQRALLDSDDEDMEEPKDRQIQKGALDITATPQAIRNGSPVESPVLPAMSSKTPQSIIRSARKLIPGLPLSDDMPIGLTQAFAATMADSQSQDSPSLQEQDSLAMIQDLPEPQFPSTLQRLDSIDMITDSQPASQTQTLGLNLSFPQSQSQSQIVPESPVRVSATQYSELPEPTQDTDFVLSPFADRRFDTPVIPHSTVDTVLLPMDASPVVQRRGRLRRGNATRSEDQDDMGELLKDPSAVSAFEKMREAAREKERREAFDKSKSNAKEAVDEAAEESEDEYAGLGGASDDEDGVELEEDRRMINDDSNEKVDERQLAALHA
jgi:mediator of replication checkpoint protein 1